MGAKYNAGQMEDYGAKWGARGDIVECVLNLNTMELSYIVNNKKQPIAFILNKEKTYHFVFNFWSKDSITVISETIEKIPKNPS